MEVLSVNTGLPAQVEWQGVPVRTAIFKYPVTGPRKVNFLHIEGDQQADHRYHGGKYKAVYSYDLSHYAHWKKILKRADWQYGLFGENLTTDGLPEEEVRHGNIYQIGTAFLQAIEPRFPCSKLNIRFGSPGMAKLFHHQKRFGIYFKVTAEGVITPGDRITLAELSSSTVTLQDMTEAHYTRGKDKGKLQQILGLTDLSALTKKKFQKFVTSKTLFG